MSLLANAFFVALTVLSFLSKVCQNFSSVFLIELLIEPLNMSIDTAGKGRQLYGSVYYIILYIAALLSN